MTSLTVAGSTAVLATIVGTLCALGLERMRGWLRQLFDSLIYIAIMVPGVVIGISTLIAIVTLFDTVNPVLEAIGLGPAANGPVDGDCSACSVQPGSGGAHHQGTPCRHGQKLGRGVRRPLCHALATFRQVALPALMPPILASLLLSFTFSFEDFIITLFVAGPNTTLPIYMYSSIRRGVTPEINAIGTCVLLTSLALLVLAQFLLRSRPSPAELDFCSNSDTALGTEADNLLIQEAFSRSTFAP